MRISIIIPCHNAEPFLAQTIGSVLEQSLTPGEIIVIDDQSTDGSPQIARHFEERLPDIMRVIPAELGGAPFARNMGARLATGEALMFLDADDLLAPETLEVLAQALKCNPGGIAACPWRRLDRIEGKWISQPASCALRKPEQDPLSAWLTGWYYPPCAVLWSKEAFVFTGGWDERAVVNQDGDLMMRALAGGVPFVETSQGVSYYRRMPEGQASLSGKRLSPEGTAGRLAVIEKIGRYLEEQGRLDVYREPLSLICVRIARESEDRYNELSEKASAMARAYAPSLYFRLRKKFAGSNRPNEGSKPNSLPPRDRVEEIRFGLDRAEKILNTPRATRTALSQSDRLRDDRPAVSVIIPVYNRSHLLSRTLAGVLGQAFTDFEVLIVDDCSNDDPSTIVACFDDPRLRYLRQPSNMGVAAARNRGLREARAPLVAFLDDDDEWFPDKLALQVELFGKSSPEVGLIYTGVETIFSDGSRKVYMPTERGDLYRKLLVRNILHGAPSSGMIRRNVITEAGFFDESLPAIEDYDYWLRVCRCCKVDFVSKPLIRYNDNRDLSLDTDKARRSLNINANMEARNQFYRKHEAGMRRAGVAHLFLIESARRHLKGGRGSLGKARLLAVHAFLLAPTSWQCRYVLYDVFLPREVRRFPGAVKQFFLRITRAGEKN